MASTATTAVGGCSCEEEAASGGRREAEGACGREGGRRMEGAA